MPPTHIRYFSKLISALDFETALKEYHKRKQPKFKRFSDNKIWEKLLSDESIEDEEEEEEFNK